MGGNEGGVDFYFFTYRGLWKFGGRVKTRPKRQFVV